VVSQSFALLNSENTRNRALALAKRLEEAGGTLDAKIARVFLLTYGRAPSGAETALCREHVRKMLEHHRTHIPVRHEPPSVVRRKVIQEETGLEIAWDEPLDVLPHYYRDAMPC
jgi:hypothetical protein